MEYTEIGLGTPGYYEKKFQVDDVECVVTWWAGKTVKIKMNEFVTVMTPKIAVAITKALNDIISRLE